MVDLFGEAGANLTESDDFTLPDLNDDTIAEGWWKPMYPDSNLQPGPSITVVVRIGRRRWNVESLAPALYDYVDWIVLRLDRIGA